MTAVGLIVAALILCEGIEKLAQAIRDAFPPPTGKTPRAPRPW